MYEQINQEVAEYVAAGWVVYSDDGEEVVLTRGKPTVVGRPGPVTDFFLILLTVGLWILIRPVIDSFWWSKKEARTVRVAAVRYPA